MTHRGQHQKPHSHIWFSFALGSIIGASGLFLIGTAQGRRLLKKAMESAEHLEESVADMLSRLEEEDKPAVHEDSTLHTVLHKIQTILPHKEK